MKKICKKLFNYSIVFILSLFSITGYSQVKSVEPNWGTMKYGLFVHFVYGGEYGGMTPISSAGGYPANIDEFAGSFDVQKFANDVQDMGFEYVILTAWHANMGVLYPSKVMADYGFDQHDHFTSKRDLLGEIMDSLAVRGIKFSIYTHIFVGHDFHPQGSGYFSYDNKTGIITQDMINSGYVDAVNGDSKKWNDFVNAVYDEMSSRYGEKVCSYWFDGTWVSNSWVDKQRMMQTIRKSNKICAFVANGTPDHGLPYSSKEVNNVASGEYSFSKDYPGVIAEDVNTWPSYKRHIALVQSGNWWASQWGSPRFTAEQVYRFTVFQASTNNGGGVGWSFGPFVNGDWEGDMLARMSKVGDYIAPVAESIKKTRASTSYVTKEGSRITALPGKYVATQSVNGLYEYIHVLNQPEGSVLKLPISADGRVFSEALLLEKNKPVELLKTVRGYTLTLSEGENWNSLNTVFRLKLSSFTLSGTGTIEKFINPWSGYPVKVVDKSGNTINVTYFGDSCSIASVAGMEYIISQVSGPIIKQAKVEGNTDIVTIIFDKKIIDKDTIKGLSLILNGTNAVGIDSVVYQSVNEYLRIYTNTSFTKNDELKLSYSLGNIFSLDTLPMLDVTGYIVDNLLKGSSPRLLKAETDMGGNKILLVFNKKMKLPASVDFSVFNSTLGKNMVFSSIAFDGNDSTKICLNASQQFYVDDILTFSCGATSISSSDGGFLKALEKFPIINIAPGIAPKVVAAQVKIDALTINIDLDKPILDVSQLKSKFLLEVNNVAKAFQSVESNNGAETGSIVLSLSNAIKHGEKVTVSFSGDTIFSQDGGMLTTIDKYPVANNVPAVYVPKHFLNISGNGSSGIQRDTLYISRLIYTDRAYEFTEIPDSLVGAEYIRWANGLKSTNAEVLLSFNLAVSGKLYVGHDTRINKPEWLTLDFAKTDQTFPIAGVNSELYYKKVLKGDLIKLGANQIKGTETGGCNNYVVFFVPDKGTESTFLSIQGIDEIYVYPNPVKDLLYIQCKQFKPVVAQIIDLTGKIVFETRLSEQMKINEIPINLSVGNYVLVLLNQKGEQVSRLLTISDK